MGRHRSHNTPIAHQSIRPAPYPTSILDNTTSGYTSWSSRNGKAINPEFKRFQKEYNLMLNSITDSNTAEVLERVRQLVLREVVPRLRCDAGEVGTDAKKEVVGSGDGASGASEGTATASRSDHPTTPTAPTTSTAGPYLDHLTKQLVSAASAQVLYSESYATLLKSIIDTGDLDTVTTESMVKCVIDNLLSVDVSNINKMNAKGYGCFMAYLHLGGLVERHVLETYSDQWVVALMSGETLDNEMAVCELLVHICLTLGKTSVVRDLWRSRIREKVAPMWENDSGVGMRIRMRLWDVRDVFDV